MSHESRSVLEQQLAQQLRQTATQQATSLMPLPWPLAADTPKRWWQFALIPVASAAAIGWLALGNHAWLQQPVATESAPRPPMLITENYQLEALDQRIQRAYLQGADDNTIAQLWQQRQYWTEQQRINQEWTQ